MPTNTRTSYQRLGLATQDLSEYLPFRDTKPKMLDNSANSMKNVVEEALARQREEMMNQFSQILKTQQLPSSVAPFHGNSPFKVQVNFDILNFEGKVDADVVNNWLSKLDRYFFVNHFFDAEKITFSFLKVETHVKLAWKTKILNKESEAGEGLGILSDNKPNWGEIVET